MLLQYNVATVPMNWGSISQSAELQGLVDIVMVLPMHKYMDAYSLKHNAASKHKNSACYKELLPRNLQQYVECR